LLQQLAPLRREAPAGRCDAHDGGGRPERKRVRRRRDDRQAVLLLPGPGRVDERDGRGEPVPDDPARGLAVVRVAGVVLGQDQIALLAHAAQSTRGRPPAAPPARVRSTVGRPASSQSTASTFGPLEPGPLPPPALALPGAIWEPLRLEQVVSASRTRGRRGPDDPAG